MPQDHSEIIHKQLPNSEFIPKVIELIEQGHTVTLPLKGFSMRPFLEDGRDKALLSKPIGIRVGDAVLAEISSGHFVLHRVVKICNNTVTLRGDGNLTTETCRLEDIHAFVIGFYRKGRTKLEKTNGMKWMLYSWFWMHSLWLRPYMLKAYRGILKLKNILNK